MKKLFLTVAAVLAIQLGCAAQSVTAHAGIMGGCALDRVTGVNSKSLCSWHAGATVLVNIPAYFSIQPSVRYNQFNSYVNLDSGNVTTMRLNQLNIPVAVQWGPDLGVFRPFVQVVPYATFNLNADYMDPSRANEWQGAVDYIKRAQFGIGLGAGLNIWRFQFSCRYNWDLGDWTQAVEGNPFRYANGFTRSITFSLSFFFN